MLNSLENFFLNPVPTLNNIIEKRKIGMGMFGYGVAAFSMAVFLNIAEGASIAGFIVSFLSIFLFYMVACAVFSAGVQLFLDFITRRGSVLGLFGIMGLVGFANALLVAFALIGNAAPEFAFVKALGLLTVLVIQLFMLTAYINRAYNISKFISFVSIVAPVASAFLLFFFMLFASVWGLVRLLSAMF
ncbi:hypothetical protein Dip518_000991 [Parelusimicrobium proximum]|uniref:hypothetical protein n=1 Tax=Parelusimicrobium proximum TaxID=3228953 RepID=UPI003D169EC5